MIGCARVLDRMLGRAYRLVHPSLQPEDLSKHPSRDHLLVVDEADPVRAVSGGDIAIEHPLEMTPCSALVPQIVQR
jgi:hypothetical protein